MSKYEPGEVPKFAFCEATTASGRSPWHIRQVTAQGLKLTGGVDTPSLCGHVHIRYGWDLNVKIDAHHLRHACPRCVAEYEKLGR
jgi:hypothetical protein